MRPTHPLALSFRLLALIAIAVSLMGCGKKKSRTAAVKGDGALSTLVSGFSGGAISADGPLRVTLVNSQVDSTSIHKVLAKNPFDLSPAIKGSAVWIDEKTLEFRPTERFTRGKTYTVVLHLDQIMQVPDKLKNFEFEFSAMEQYFESDLGGLEMVDENDLKWQRLQGLMRIADGEDASLVEATLSAFQNGKAVTVQWEHKPDRHEHPFKIDSLVRGEKAGELILKWNGSSIGVDKQDVDTIRIPSINDFQVSDVKVEGGDERYISVRFSDPPQRGLDFRGLIEVTDQTGLRFQVEGNEVRIYVNSEIHGSQNVKVNAGIKNSFGKRLQNPGSWNVVFDVIKPAVRFVGKGVILPGNGKMTLAFEAVNLKSVDVSVMRIYAGNVPQYLQVNALDGDNQITRVGRPMLKKTIKLNTTGSASDHWTRYGLDLTELSNKDAQPGTLYRVTLTFRKSQSSYPCADAPTSDAKEKLNSVDEELTDENWDGESGYHNPYDYYQDEGEDYSWEERENPCSSSFYHYNNQRVSRNFLASDIGLMAKMGKPGKIVVIATNLLTAGPMDGVDITITNYQHQVIGKGKTNSDGFIDLEITGKPFLLMASKGDERGYLKVDESSALQLGQFDVGGVAVQEGLKGYLFGERGVWRPGDSLYLTFILEDKDGRLPQGHPISFELRNPQGQVVRTLARTAQGGFYSFATNTDVDAPTGEYLAKVKAGPAVFEQSLKIETVMPNRLKIKIALSPKPLSLQAPVSAQLNVSWLSGAVAKNLEAEVEMTLQNTTPLFKGFEDYTFTDPARQFTPETQTLWQGRINGEGAAKFQQRIKLSGTAPGPLRASFRTKVLEAGGAFSLDRFSETVHPYNAYVGIHAPILAQGYQMLTIDSLHQIKICALNPEGHKLGKRRIEIKLFKMDWNWWWERENGDASFLQNESKHRVQSDTVTLVGGQGTWGLKVKYPNYGRYVLRACDLDGGSEAHCTGESFYMDWPYWYGRGERDGKEGGASILTFKSDKTKYNVGEKMRITIPSPKGGRALISMEKGSGVFKRYWIDLKPNETVHEILVEPEMAPNIYLYVALLQPHSQTENDLPIRMYNVIPISVEDPSTRLHPTVKTEPEIFRPGERATILVNETSGKAMSYVVAVVDEGLLDLTRFKTPDPWERFYAREALGIKTWDLYDFVAGAYGDKLARILSIGGDMGGPKNPTGRKGNRFPPMVKFLGPFDLGKGQQAKHTIAIPEYVGAVRVMVVAGNAGAYGFGEQSVFVRKPLMVLATLPRILAPGESFELPVSVFAMEKNVKDVDVEVTTTGPIKLVGESHQNISIQAPADELVQFKLETKEAVGWSKVTIKAKSGTEKAEQTIEVQVRNPNSKVTDVMAELVQPNTKWSQTFNLPGVGGTNKATLELSKMPPINLEKQLSYLIQYPHGCIEQTTSSAFPQLYLSGLMELPEQTKKEIEKNVKAALNRLISFQTPSGGFSYWPGEPYPNDWGSSYAGHFIIEAEKKGYSLPAGMLDQWKRYQRNLAQSWTAKYDYYAPLSQSYRLYTLALSGSPEMGPMNRLKESKYLDVTARWQLGAAYQLAGQHEVALSLIKGNTQVKPYTEMNGNFGSDIRDKAMMLNVLCLMDKKTEASPLMLEVSKALSSGQWYSTQTTAYSLIAVSKFAETIFDRGGKIAYAMNGNGVNQTGTLSAPLLQKEIKILEGQANQLDLQNKGPGLLYARLIVEGIPKLGMETETSQGLTLSMQYLDMQGKAISPTQFDQGQDFVAEFKVHHNSSRGPYEQLALTCTFPSGFEIRNTRLDEIAAPKGKGAAAAYTYQDIRDDRVLTYFNLNTGEEKLFRVYLNAAYLGKFHQPQSKVEAMYDATISARTLGRVVDIIPSTDKPGNPKLPSVLGKKNNEE